MNQKGIGLSDIVFWILLAAVVFWLGKQFLPRLGDIKPVPAAHSALEDRPK